MSADDLAVARQFLDALAAGAKTGELDGVFPFLAADVEWVTPLRDLRSVGEVRKELHWFTPRETLDVDFEELELIDLGGGRFALDFHETYRTKRGGELAYERDRRIELAIRDGKVARYEMRFSG